MIRVLFCALKNEYGNPQKGSSFEYQNFFNTLKNMPGVEVEFFQTDDALLVANREEINKKLVLQVQERQYDLLFCFLFTEEIKKETIDYITKNTKTKTFNWFADDHWRFPVFSKYWAPLFTAVSTTDSKAVSKYQRLGIKNVIKTQWAANHYLYFPQTTQPEEKKYDITFVGKNYGNRGEYVMNLQKAGLPTTGFGGGWSSGRVSQQEMLKIFSFSKINLNFTESPYMTTKDRLKILAKLVVKKELGQYKFNMHHFWSNFQSAIGTQRRQIKGRTFEVSACGGFLLTGDADNLREYFVDGKEIVIFKNKDDLADKCKYYLEHEEERKTIAKAGLERTLRDHTYEQRFKEIFKAVNLI